MEENQDTNTQIEDTSNNQEVTAPTQVEPINENTHLETIPSPQNEKRKFKHKKLVLLLVATALLVGGASAGATYYFVNKNNKNSSNNEEASADASQVTGLEAKEVTEKTGVVASSYTWLDTPKEVDTLPLFKNPEATGAEDYEAEYATSLQYYLIGNGGDGSEVYAVAGPEEMGGRPYMLVLKNANEYSILREHSNTFFYSSTENGALEYHGPELLPGVTVDPTSTIADVLIGSEVAYKGQKFSTTGMSGSENPKVYLTFMSNLPTSSEYQTYVEAGKIAEGTVYENISKDDPTYRVSRFELRIKPPFYVTLYIKGELSDQEVDPITWSDGSKNTVNYMSAGRGCGGGMSNEIAKYGKDQLVQIGKSDKGQIIYGFKDNTNALLLKHHEEYLSDSKNIDEWISGDESFYKKANFGLAIDQYVTLRPLYVVEDGMGRLLVFSRQDLVLVGGCAKPVVYAYPTAPTLINVSVGADVTVSDPLYEANGWNNVMAMPNGLLGYNGRQYDSLFWEGFGHGTYPEITKGTVVAKDEVKTTLWANLTSLGLNQKESTDFMEFWSAKIPNSPYVRLSWLGTNELERLAPLYISPAPDTRIRVFLDMEGLPAYQAMTPQVLTSQPRVGFTVVEWGGLVTDGSVPLLR